MWPTLSLFTKFVSHWQSDGYFLSSVRTGVASGFHEETYVHACSHSECRAQSCHRVPYVMLFPTDFRVRTIENDTYQISNQRFSVFSLYNILLQKGLATFVWFTSRSRRVEIDGLQGLFFEKHGTVHVHGCQPPGRGEPVAPQKCNERCVTSIIIVSIISFGTRTNFVVHFDSLIFGNKPLNRAFLPPKILLVCMCHGRSCTNNVYSCRRRTPMLPGIRCEVGKSASSHESWSVNGVGRRSTIRRPPSRAPFRGQTIYNPSPGR